MRIIVLSSVLAAALGTAALAAPLSREAGVRMIAQRHAGYEQLGKAMRAAKQSIDKGDVAGARGAANQIAALAARAPGWFPAGSGPEAGKTHARALVWQQRADFDAKMKDLGNASRLFKAAAAGGDIAAIKAAHASSGRLAVPAIANIARSIEARRTCKVETGLIPHVLRSLRCVRSC